MSKILIMSTQTQENYLKCIYKLSTQNIEGASTNAIAKELQARAATVTDMLKKLAEKKLINYTKYKSVSLTVKGNKLALEIIRRHRLWEVFLVNTLHFKWDEVHEVAEQLEHINSEKLIENLNNFLGNPKFDPHGDPIPDKHGKMIDTRSIPLSEAKIGDKLQMTGVLEHSNSFLNYLNEINLLPNQKFTIKKINPFDQSMQIEILKGNTQFISSLTASNILVKCL